MYSSLVFYYSLTNYHQISNFKQHSSWQCRSEVPLANKATCSAEDLKTESRCCRVLLSRGLRNKYVPIKKNSSKYPTSITCFQHATQNTFCLSLWLTTPSNSQWQQLNLLRFNPESILSRDNIKFHWGKAQSDDTIPQRSAGSCKLRLSAMLQIYLLSISFP